MAGRPDRTRGDVPVLELRALKRTLGEGETALEVLHGLDLEIRRGEFCAIVGPSGSGKSTLMYLMGALDRPSSGDVRIDGASTSRLADHELAAVRNRKLGFIFQFHYLLPEFSALENVMMPMFRMGTPRAEAEARAVELLDQLGLGGKTGRVPAKLSGGEQQRVAIARALANRPLMVLGDEPSGNLDTQNADNVFQIFEKLVREEKQTIVVVTHDLAMAARTDRLIWLVDGKIVEDGPTAQVMESMRRQTEAAVLTTHE